jgi:hypothetical protein
MKSGSVNLIIQGTSRKYRDSAISVWRIEDFLH